MTHVLVLGVIGHGWVSASNVGRCCSGHAELCGGGGGGDTAVAAAATAAAALAAFGTSAFPCRVLRKKHSREEGAGDQSSSLSLPMHGWTTCS
jgi:hypothetical protein